MLFIEKKRKENEIISCCLCWIETVVLLKHIVLLNSLVLMYITGFHTNMMDLDYWCNSDVREV